MKTLLPQFILSVLLFAACQGDEEEIIPARSDTQHPAAEHPSPDGSPSPVKGDSTFYAYGVYKNLPYRYLAPPEKDTPLAYPMFIFLHGMGERGKNNEAQLNIGASYFLRDSIRENYPALVVYPQCPANAYWFDADIMTLVKDLTDSLRNAFAIDPMRISIGGFSMGAYGTFEITSRFPGFFEAALAISGDGDEAKAKLMAESRWRIVAGARDDVVPSTKSRQIATAIKQAGASVGFTLYEHADHHRTWVYAFAEPDLFAWLFRPATPVVALPFHTSDSVKLVRHTGT